MDKHTYDMKAEALQGQMRVEKIRGMQQEVQIEKANADIKTHHATLARTKVQIAGVESVTETFKLSQARVQQRMETIKLTGTEQDVNHEFRKTQLKQKVLDTQYEGLQTDLSTARKMLQQRRELLKQQGVFDG